MESISLGFVNLNTKTGETMITFNEAEETEKMLNRLKMWDKINIEEFIESFNVRPFVKRDLKRRFHKYGRDMFTGATPDQFKGLIEYCEQVELAIK